MTTMRATRAAFAALAVAALAVGTARGGFVAYNFSPGQAGNQSFGGELGNDFTVNVPIKVTHMGVYDDLSNGIGGTLTSQLWTRSGNTGGLVAGTSTTFTSGSPGTLDGAVRLKALGSPIVLPVGTYTFSSNGHSGADQNLNSNAGGFLRYANNGYGAVTSGPGTAPGLITIPGQKRYGMTPNAFPANADGNWLYGSGTFAYEQAYSTAYTVQDGAVGTQNFGGSLGMDFKTYRPVTVTHLGVFDSGQDGLNGTITARLYARGPGNTGTELAQLTFTGTAGQLIGGTRFLALATPVELPRGFEGTMVAEGYNALEMNGNTGGSTPALWRPYSGEGAIAFVGSGRWGTAGLFPTNPDGGGVDRYAAGSFMFAPVGAALPLSRPEVVNVANGSFEQPPRPQQPAGGYYGPANNWTAQGDAGHFHPAPWIFTDPIPDGSQVAYVNSGAIVSDPLPGPGLEADTLYILEVDWGNRTDNPTPYHSMNLRAGGQPLGWLNDSNMRKGQPVGLGQFEANRLYCTANHNAAIGSPLDIKLDAGGSQAIYDNVRLTKVSDGALLVRNHSFEYDNVGGGGGWQEGATGWAASGTGGGIFEHSGEIIPADGSQSLFVRGGGSLTQTLDGMLLEPGFRYILLADVADRRGTTFAGYQLELLAGGETIGIDDDSMSVITFGPGGADQPGYFYVTAVVDALVTGAHPLLGEELGVRLSALGTGGNQTYFDNVRLFVVLVPEPSTMLLLAGGCLAVLRRRKRR